MIRDGNAVYVSLYIYKGYKFIKYSSTYISVGYNNLQKPTSRRDLDMQSRTSEHEFLLNSGQGTSLGIFTYLFVEDHVPSCEIQLFDMA